MPASGIPTAASTDGSTACDTPWYSKSSIIASTFALLPSASAPAPERPSTIAMPEAWCISSMVPPRAATVLSKSEGAPPLNRMTYFDGAADALTLKLGAGARVTSTNESEQPANAAMARRGTIRRMGTILGAGERGQHCDGERWVARVARVPQMTPRGAQ